MTAAPSFVEALRTHARARPGDPAVLDGGLPWSWAELERKAELAAAGLKAAGILPGDRVGLLASSSAVVVAALHAVVGAGIVAVPIGPRLTRPEIAAIEAAAGLRAILAPDGAATLIEAPRRAPTPGTPAVIVPTSGTTGRPKLVRLGADRLDASAAAWTATLPPATGWLLSLNLAHVSGIGIVVRATRAGVPVVVPISTEAEPIGPSLAAARSAGILVSHISLVVPQLVRLLDTRTSPPDELRAVLLGGGPIPESLVVRALTAGWPIVPSYGMTETASGVVALPLGQAGRHPWSAGLPLPGVDLRIEAMPGGGASRDAILAAPPGTVGEILVRGPMVFDGYENDPEASSSALDERGWLRTGDLGSLDADGWLRVVARRDEMILSGGENVAPAEIEAVLASHPAVADAGVTGVADERWGSVPAAVVAFRSGEHESAEALRTFVRERLASFKVPALIVEVAAVPRSPAGKLDRRALKALVGAAERRPWLTGTTRIEADDGQPLATRDLAGPAGAPAVLLLHATLSTSGQLLRIANLLKSSARVVLLDRRGSGASAMSVPAPVSIARHVADIRVALDALGVDRPVIFGHSFGALMAIEFAARHPERVAAVIAYEPPYLAIASASLSARIRLVGEAVQTAYASGGPAAAAQLFVRSVAGDGAWDLLGPAQRELLEAEGASALADTSMAGLDIAGLARIACPVVLATGGASDDFYAPIADALAVTIRGARRVVLPNLRHVAPITDPAPFADLIGLLTGAAGR